MTETPAPSAPAPKLTRKAQREATHAALLQVAVMLLIERGAAGVTTLEVQQRADVSRGALLHHFPTRAHLLSATVTELIRRNEEAVWREQAHTASEGDPLTEAIRSLVAAASTSSYVAEMELWAVSRTDPALRDTLRAAEQDALKARERVLDELFAPLRHEPGYRRVVELSIEFVRGLALSNLLLNDSRRSDELVAAWVDAARLIIERARDPLGGKP